MNYEELYAAFLSQDKQLTDLMKNQQKVLKRIEKSLEAGDVKSAAKDIALLKNIAADGEQAAAGMDETVSGFDAQGYMRSGAFAEQMLEYFRQARVDAKGEGTVYEVFPYRIRIDADAADVYIDRKRVPCSRPLRLVQEMKKSRERLLSSAFNPELFASELAAAYDLTILLQSRTKKLSEAPDLYLTQLYKQMTPMRRSRRDYDMQAFAFDLARLYSADVGSLEDGRRFQFGPSRDITKSIRVLDRDGNEEYLATIRFYQSQETE